MKVLSRTQRGECDVQSFVQTALSAEYFERERGEQCAAPLVALVQLVPDEHTALREELMEALRREGVVA
eukprot:2561159-Prymnesium_polylepis.1